MSATCEHEWGEPIPPINESQCAKCGDWTGTGEIHPAVARFQLTEYPVAAIHAAHARGKAEGYREGVEAERERIAKLVVTETRKLSWTLRTLGSALAEVIRDENVKVIEACERIRIEANGG